VRFADHDLTGASEAELTRYRREHVGFVFQFYNLIPSLTVRENVAWSPTSRRPMSRRGAGLVGLTPRRDHFPAQLSGGEQQRVAIARAIVKRPDVLLCDEPTGALDYATGKLVLEVIARINRELGTTTVVITHNAAIAAMADRVIRTWPTARIQRDRAQRAPAEPVGAVVVAVPAARPRRAEGPGPQAAARPAPLWSQALTIALVVASGLGGFMTTCRRWTRWRWRATVSMPSARFADVFAAVKRAPRLALAEVPARTCPAWPMCR
jgi:putative ABC transport system ATP-binding protein